jgi:hypothetical protein
MNLPPRWPAIPEIAKGSQLLKQAQKAAEAVMVKDVRV